MSTCFAMGASNPIDEVNSVALSLDLLRRLPLISSLLSPLTLRSESCGGAGLEPPELDEPGRAPLIEGRTLVVGRQVHPVERVGGGPSHNPQAPLVEFQPHLSRHALLRRLYEAVEGRPERLHPQPRVD